MTASCFDRSTQLAQLTPLARALGIGLFGLLGGGLAHAENTAGAGQGATETLSLIHI